MSFYKRAQYQLTNGYEIFVATESRETARILTTFLTADQLTDWFTDDFDLSNLQVTYRSNNQVTVIGNDSAHKIVTMNVLKARFNQAIVDLKANNSIDDELTDLEDYSYVELNGEDWATDELLTALQFIKTLIDGVEKVGQSSF